MTTAIVTEVSSGTHRQAALTEDIFLWLGTLAHRAFPEESYSEALNDLIGFDLLVILTKNGDMVGAASAQIVDLDWKGKILRLVYFCSSAIEPEYRGQGLARYLYTMRWEISGADLAATTTKVPQVFWSIARLATQQRLIMSHNTKGLCDPEWYALGTQVLHQTDRDETLLDGKLVRRGYLPGSTSRPYFNFHLFESVLSLQPSDGVLLIAANTNILEV